MIHCKKSSHKWLSLIRHIILFFNRLWILNLETVKFEVIKLSIKAKPSLFIFRTLVLLIIFFLLLILNTIFLLLIFYFCFNLPSHSLIESHKLILSRKPIHIIIFLSVLISVNRKQFRLPSLFHNLVLLKRTMFLNPQMHNYSNFKTKLKLITIKIDSFRQSIIKSYQHHHQTLNKHLAKCSKKKKSYKSNQ